MEVIVQLSLHTPEYIIHVGTNKYITICIKYYTTTVGSRANRVGHVTNPE